MQNLFCKATDTIKELLLLYLSVLLLASGLLSYFEGINLADSLWLACVTATSTGYGDYAAKTLGGRITSVLLMHTTIFLIIPMIVARLLHRLVQDSNAFTDSEQEAIKQDLAELLRRTNPKE